MQRVNSFYENKHREIFSSRSSERRLGVVVGLREPGHAGGGAAGGAGAARRSQFAQDGYLVVYSAWGIVNENKAPVDHHSRYTIMSDDGKMNRVIINHIDRFDEGPIRVSLDGGFLQGERAFGAFGTGDRAGDHRAAADDLCLSRRPDPAQSRRRPAGRGGEIAEWRCGGLGGERRKEIAWNCRTNGAILDAPLSVLTSRVTFGLGRLDYRLS